MSLLRLTPVLLLAGIVTFAVPSAKAQSVVIPLTGKDLKILNMTSLDTMTLDIEGVGLANQQFGVLQVFGGANVAGTLLLNELNGFKFKPGESVTFAYDNNGFDGGFKSIESQETESGVRFSVIYSATSITLEVQGQGGKVEGVVGQLPLTAFACNPDSYAVAVSLDSALSDGRAEKLIRYLDEQPVSQLCDDFLKISPYELSSIFNIGISLAGVQTANLERRLEDFRAGVEGFDSNGLAIESNDPDFSLAGPSGPGGEAGKTINPPPEQNRWGVFITGLGDFTNVGNQGSLQGFNADSGGLTLGVDYRVCPNFGIGLTTGYINTATDLPGGGWMNVNGGKIGLYSTAFWGGLYVDGAVLGGVSGYSTRRAGLGGIAYGYTNGPDISTLLNVGYDWTKGGLSVGPLFSFQYTDVEMDGFQENGSLAPLKYGGQSADSYTTQLGAKATYTFRVAGVTLRPEVKAEWEHEYGDDSYSIISNFANGSGTSFGAKGPRIGRDGLLLALGVTVQLTPRLATYAFYDGDLGRSNYESNSVSLGVRYDF